MSKTIEINKGFTYDYRFKIWWNGDAPDLENYSQLCELSLEELYDYWIKNVKQ